MASADVIEELNCSICLEVYKDPVTLRCGHSFCRVCIDRLLDTQVVCGYSCPDCREKIVDRSALYRNITLHNIAERFLCTQSAQEEKGIFCTYCDSSVPAVQTCLLCEASLCGKHLKKHSKSPEHVLVDPTTSLENRKCPTHKEILKYYCTEDCTCICVTCCLVGEHRGDKVEPMDDASEKKKMKLRTLIEELSSKREQAERKVQTLQNHKKKVQKKSTEETGRIATLFKDLRKHMDDLEKRVLSEITKQEEQILSSISDLTQKLQVKKDDLSKTMRNIEELCNTTDSLAVLNEKGLEKTDPYNPEEEDKQDTGKGSDILCNVDILDKNLISLTLHSALTDIVSRLKKEIYIEEAADLLLDRDTASNFLQVEDDLKKVYYSKRQQYPDSAERFEDCQILSTKRFLSGQHFWEVETNKTGDWMIGVAYANIDRKGEHSYIGSNNKSWCLCKVSKKYSAIHDGKTIQIPEKCSCQRLVVCLDYKAGRLSFYELSDAIRHLYTFFTTFTLPLHAAFYIWDQWLRIRS